MNEWIEAVKDNERAKEVMNDRTTEWMDESKYKQRKEDTLCDFSIKNQEILSIRSKSYLR